MTIEAAIALAHADRDGYPLNPLIQPPPDVDDARDILIESLRTCGFNWLTGQEAVRLLTEEQNASFVKQFDKPMKWLYNLWPHGGAIDEPDRRFGRALGLPQPTEHFTMKRMKEDGCRGLYAEDLSILAWRELIDTAKENWREGRRQWLKMAQEMGENLLQCVPPALHRGDSFAVGEAYDHTAQGAPIYLCVRGLSCDAPTCLAQYLTLKEFVALLTAPR